MTTFDIIALIGSVCGIIMVCGGIILLWVGAIKLSETADKGAFSVQIRKDIKITTSYPALGIFLIGLLFIGVPMFMSQPDKEIPVNIVGTLHVSDSSGLRVQIEPDQIGVDGAPDSTGRFEKVMHPRVQRVRMTITASGYDPPTIDRLLDVTFSKLGREAVVNLPDNLNFRKIAANPGTGEIKPAEKLPPLNAPPSF